VKLLLTSGGIANPSIHDALAGLLGKPIEESSALVIPTAIYPFPGGAGHAWEAICGRSKSPFAGLGWKSLGVLELSVLPSIDEECWVPAVQETDALRRSGVPGLLDAAVRACRRLAGWRTPQDPGQGSGSRTG